MEVWHNNKITAVETWIRKITQPFIVSIVTETSTTLHGITIYMGLVGHTNIYITLVESKIVVWNIDSSRIKDCCFGAPLFLFELWLPRNTNVARFLELLLSIYVEFRTMVLINIRFFNSIHICTWDVGPSKIIYSYLAFEVSSPFFMMKLNSSSLGILISS